MGGNTQGHWQVHTHYRLATVRAPDCMRLHMGTVSFSKCSALPFSAELCFSRQMLLPLLVRWPAWQTMTGLTKEPAGGLGGWWAYSIMSASRSSQSSCWQDRHRHRLGETKLLKAALSKTEAWAVAALPTLGSQTGTRGGAEVYREETETNFCNTSCLSEHSAEKGGAALWQCGTPQPLHDGANQEACYARTVTCERQDSARIRALLRLRSGRLGLLWKGWDPCHRASRRARLVCQ